MSYSVEHTHKFWDERFGTPECARTYHYYAFEYLDDLSFLPSARKTLGDWPHASLLLEQVATNLRTLGWEGTGEFQILWLPPFAGAGPSDTFGCYTLHVKQHDDGISWIASPYVLPFHRLFQVDDATYPAPDPKNHPQVIGRKGMVRWLNDLLR